jgi:hypothetical protein
MAQLGVSPKQTGRARQVFQKSAQYAGYIDPATSRFIRPGIGPDAERKNRPSANQKAAEAGLAEAALAASQLIPSSAACLIGCPNPARSGRMPSASCGSVS